VCNRLHLYESLVNAFHVRSRSQLSLEDQQYLAALLALDPFDTTPKHTSPMTMPAAPGASATPTTVTVRSLSELLSIRPGDYKFPQLKGRENYAAWKVHIRGLFKDSDIWDIVLGQQEPVLGDTSLTQGDRSTVVVTAITQTYIDEWKKRRNFAIGKMQ
jgi:hypothetical protein